MSKTQTQTAVAPAPRVTPSSLLQRQPTPARRSPSSSPLPLGEGPGVRAALPTASFVPTSLLSAPISLQPKLTVNTPGDKYEQEADRVADMVMRMPDSMVSRAALGAVPVSTSDGKKKRVQRQCATCGAKSPSSGECPECKKKKQGLGGTLQRLSPQGDSAAGMPAPPIVSQVLSSPGSPLADSTRSFFEPRLGTDLSQIRVHTDSLASESARQVQARAYTVGNHIAFAAGEAHFGTTAGQTLLAHELTHTLQQRGENLSRLEEQGPTRSQSCGETGRWSSPEHMIIEQDYLMNIDHNGRMEYGIPGSSRTGGKGFVDLLSYSLPMIYEIKAAGDDLGEARDQLLRYRHYGSMCPGLEDLQLGIGYPSPRVIEGPTSDTELMVQQIEPGLLMYEKRQRQRVRVPVPYPVPATEKSKKKDPVMAPVPNTAPAPRPDSIPDTIPDWVWASLIAAGVGVAVAACFASGVCELAAIVAGLSAAAVEIVTLAMELAGVVIIRRPDLVFSH